MTCEEFRKFWESDDFWEVLDLECIADLDEHYESCNTCRQWIVYKDLFSNPQVTIPAIVPNGSNN